jgi:hypothetical protein
VLLLVVLEGTQCLCYGLCLFAVEGLGLKVVV